MKSKLKGAQTGHDLLKRKSEALTKYTNTPPLQMISGLMQASADVSEVLYTATILPQSRSDSV
jgi:vacuolar-type H+-ATPase subunit D/Vma8